MSRRGESLLYVSELLSTTFLPTWSRCPFCEILSSRTRGQQSISVSGLIGGNRPRILNQRIYFLENNGYFFVLCYHLYNTKIFWLFDPWVIYNEVIYDYILISVPKNVSWKASIIFFTMFNEKMKKRKLFEISCVNWF